MSVKLLRSVSAIALSASLAMPAPIMAQTPEEAPATELCPDGSEPVMQDGADAPVCPPGADAADAAAEESAADAGEPPADADAGEAAETEAEAASTEQAADGAEAAPAAESEAAAEPEVSEAPETEAEAAPEVIEDTGSEADGQASDETAAPADAQQAEEVAPSDAQPEEQEAAETTEQPAEQQAAETEEPPADQQAAEPETTTEADAEPAGEGTAEAPATATEEPVEEAATDAEATEEAAESETSEPADAEATEAVEGDAADEAPAAEVAQEDTAETTAEANEAVATEAAAAAEDGMLDTTEADNVETVTEETARSSGEEFATATAAAPAEQEDGGLSNLEIFALSALGGAAAAALLGQNERVVVSSQDRVVVEDDRGNYRVLKNDDELLRRPGVEVATREFSDGSTRTVVTREDGVRVVTIRAPNGQVLKRTRLLPDGREIVLFDDTVDVEPVDMSFLEQFNPQERVRAADSADTDALRAALQSLENPTDRGYSLQQIRQIRAVRDLVPEIDLDEVNFETGSAVIRPDEAQDLSAIGKAIAAAIDENPNEVFLIEGHTDATGGAAMNLALSDRRAESAALALTEYFDIPPENLVVQGYGESNLKIRTNEAERANRRVSVRRITPLLYARSN